jgi:hypothetical protein
MREIERASLVIIHIDSIRSQSGGPVGSETAVEGGKLRATGRASAAPEADDDDFSPVLRKTDVPARYGTQRKIRRLAPQELITRLRHRRR